MSDLNMPRPAPRSVLRALKRPIFDSYTIRKGSTTECMVFFTNPLYTPGSDGYIKTEWHTNLVQSGQLQTPYEFDLYGFEIEMLNFGIKGLAADTIEDIYNLGLYGFYFGRGKPWLKAPLTQIPSPVIRTCILPYSDDVSFYLLPERNQEELDDPAIKRMYDFTVNKEPIRIVAQEQFSSTIELMEEVTAKEHIMIRNIFVGIMYCPL